VARAAEIARAHGIPVTVDVDTVYHGFDRVLPNIDYLITSSEFPPQWTNERDPFRALIMIQEEFGMKVAAMTLGAFGAIARMDGQFVLLARFCRRLCRYDQHGDVFHGAFCYSVLSGLQSARFP
jgi:sulfofructose kinase